ncbi:MAG: hypothetical protein L6265_05885 [Thermoplasmatales archaeon]|nr:hypothetical protein [Thermoplasmatales archaeon]
MYKKLNKQGKEPAKEKSDGKKKSPIYLGLKIEEAVEEAEQKKKEIFDIFLQRISRHHIEEGNTCQPKERYEYSIELAKALMTLTPKVRKKFMKLLKEAEKYVIVDESDNGKFCKWYKRDGVLISADIEWKGTSLGEIKELVEDILMLSPTERSSEELVVVIEFLRSKAEELRKIGDTLTMDNSDKIKEYFVKGIALKETMDKYVGRNIVSTNQHRQKEASASL